MPPRGKQPAVRDPPPPLPGGYKVGEKVFFTGANQTVSTGNKLVHGQQGEVTGPGTGEDGDKRVSVRFPGNKAGTNCLLTQVWSAASAPPPLPSPACAPHTRRCPRPDHPSSRNPACAPAPQPQTQAQLPAP